MRAGIAFLVAGYTLSQFYRAFLAVLTPALKADIGATAGDLAISLGLWFLTFALMQIPVGIALDRIGPRRTAAVLLGAGGAGGAAAFAMAQGPWAIHLGMILTGIGCSPVLMASYYIFARSFPAAIFGTLAGAIIGVGSLGNILSAAPLAAVVAALGWRQTMWLAAAMTLVVAAGIAAFVRDPDRIGRIGAPSGSLRDILRIPGFWAILPLMAVAYAPAAAIRGLWAGPYLGGVYGADAAGIGRATLVMGLAMVAGNFAYGPMDRLFRSWKVVITGGTVLCGLALAALVVWPAPGFWTSTGLLAAIGFFGASFPAIMAHGRAFFPAHLMGRGVAFLNMFGIGGAGILQFASRPVYDAASAGGNAAAAFSTIFLFFLVPLAAGLAIYLFSRDAPE
jgi:predicted MFS family arabinose efflux permease